MNYPKVFSATVQTIQGTNTLWNSKVPHLESPIKCAIPPEFQGPGGGYYPEDLFLLAALNCFTATFKVVAQNSKLEFRELTLMGQLTVDLDQDKKPWMATLLM